MTHLMLGAITRKHGRQYMYAGGINHLPRLCNTDHEVLYDPDTGVVLYSDHPPVEELQTVTIEEESVIGDILLGIVFILALLVFMAWGACYQTPTPPM